MTEMFITLGFCRPLLLTVVASDLSSLGGILR